MVLHKDWIIGNMSFLARFDSWAEAIDLLFSHLDFLESFPVFISIHAPLKTNLLSLVLAIWQQLLGRSEAHLKCHRMSHETNYGCRNDHFLFFFLLFFVSPCFINLGYWLMPGRGKAKVSTVLWQSQHLYSLAVTRTCTEHHAEKRTCFLIHAPLLFLCNKGNFLLI